MTIAIFGIIMENFPNICSCLFAFNIILRLARNCHIKQIFENFSILSPSSSALFLVRRSVLRPPFSHFPQPAIPPFTLPTLSSTTTTCHTLLTITNLTISPHRFLSHPLPCRPLTALFSAPLSLATTLPISPTTPIPPPRSPLFLPLLRGRRAPLSAHTRFNLKKVFVIYVQKRKFVVE